MRKWFLLRSLHLTLMIGMFAAISSRAMSQQEPTETPEPAKAVAQPVDKVENPQPSTEPAKANTEAATEEPRSGLIDFDRDIRPILDAKCVECHGPKKASNDYRVDQQDSLLTYVVPGSLDSSQLWTDYLITDDEEMKMPPAKHDNPLTGAELALIKVWIEEGAHWKEPSEVPAADDSTESPSEPTEGPTSETSPAATTPATLQEKLWEFQGYFHPAMVHFPVALLIMAALFGIGAVLFGETCELVAFHCLWVGALGAVASCVMGWSFADICGYGSDPWEFDWNSAVTRHRWSGIVLAGLSLCVWFVAVIARWSESSSLRAVWIVGALASAALVGIVGHQGGEMTYGEGMYDKAFKNLLGQSSSKPEVPQQSQAVEKAIASVAR